MSVRVFIALHRGPGLIGTLIRWQTRSPYSHASIVLRQAAVIESREGIGVRWLSKLQPAAGEQIDLFAVELTIDQANKLEAFLLAQLGKRYDWSSVLRFVSRRQASRRSREVWFCSELVFAAFQHVGINLLARTEPWEVSPGLLSRSPLITPVRTTQGHLAAA